MWLLLCTPDDASALWLYHCLQQQHTYVPIEIVTPAELLYSVRWVETLGIPDAQFEITLSDGRRIRSTIVRGVINRLTEVPTQQLAYFAASDRAYVHMEWHALLFSWLHRLPRVVNPPVPPGLSGTLYTWSEWQIYAHRVELPTRGYALQSGVPPALESSVTFYRGVSMAGQWYGTPIPALYQTACARLVQTTQAVLLEICLGRAADGSWFFVEATPFADFRCGGVPLVTAVAHYLEIG